MINDINDNVYFILVVNIMHITNIAYSVDFNYFVHIMDLEYIVVVVVVSKFMVIDTIIIMDLFIQ